MKFTPAAAFIAFSALAGAALAQPPGGGMRAADTNGDGNITRAEFDAANAARFERQDANHDGSLQQSERMPPGGGAGGPPPGAPQGGPPPGMNPDANNDGVVTRAEFDANAAARFQRMDANGDGQIAASELPAGPPGGASPR